MSRQAYPTQLRDHLGNDVRIPPKPFAVGGEGAVFDVLGRPDLVAKIYSKPQSKERCDKLRAMAKLCSPGLLKIAAWPTATLSANGPASIDGILMPKVAGYSEIHHLYSVAQRKKEFPEADWGFLLHTARNCAIAFEEVHAHGHVVGDVNQKNVMVSKKGIVAFVDCDSFQVAEGSRIFRCGVGVPEYTPPELHGKNFASLDRSANHDLFGLGVLVFHLLMMGRHPFSGVPLVQADIPIEKAIQEGYYAYSRDTASARLKPPPHVPPAAMLDASILDLFERAFRAGSRPTASEWRAGLDAAMKSLSRCKNDPRHSYLAAAGRCPWCELISAARLMFFVPSQGAAAAAFRVEHVQQLIERLDSIGASFKPYTRPRAILSVKLSIPPGSRRSHPRPQMKSNPPKPPMPARPVMVPLPAAPPLLPLPALKPHPTPPKPSPPPPIRPYPPFGGCPPQPPLASPPHPPAGPPRPRLKDLPHRPPYPKLVLPSGPDMRLSKACLAGMAISPLIIFVMWPLRLAMMLCFAFLWMFLLITKDDRHRRSIVRMSRAHEDECRRIDEKYAQECKPVRAMNKQAKDEWKAEYARQIKTHSEICRTIERSNQRLLAKWRAQVDEIENAHRAVCEAIDAENRRVQEAWDRVEADRRSEHLAACHEVDQENRPAILEWESVNAQRQAAHSKACEATREANEARLADWEREVRRIEMEFERACADVAEANRRALESWEAMNAPWKAEVARWTKQLADDEAVLNRLESNLVAKRRECERRVQNKKAESQESVAGCERIIKEYGDEVKRSQSDSEKIQLEEFLDSRLIREAKIKAINNDRLLSLESFGIETAKDIPALENLKVPGIGAVLKKRLINWREDVERSFKPKLTLPDSEVRRLAAKFAPVLGPIGDRVAGVIKNIESIISEHSRAERELISQITTAVENKAVAESHLRALNSAA